MQKEKLNKELLSLIHHLRLNEAGWWDKGIQQLIIATIWISNNALSLREICNLIKRDFSISIVDDRIEKNIGELLSIGNLICDHNGMYKITEDTKRDLEESITKTEAELEAAKIEFARLLDKHKLPFEKDQCWEVFNKEFIVPFIQSIGAEIYGFFEGDLKITGSIRINDFLEKYPEEYHSKMVLGIDEFFSSKKQDVRSYILRNLSAFFFVESSGLSESTLEYLNSIMKIKPKFDLYIDTNFLFSLLDLHENPSNMAVNSIFPMADNLSGKVDITFKIFSHTIEEARRALSSIVDSYSNISPTKNIAQATKQIKCISGVAKKYFEETLKKETNITDYLKPYIDNLIQITKDKGVEYIDKETNHYRIDQNIIDDLEDQIDYEQKHNKIPKGRKQLEHDIILWYLVHEQRPNSFDSPIEAVSWIITLDYRFLGFDRYKIKQRNERIPQCILPSTFTSLMNFWVPRTPEFEEAMLNSARLPFFFHEYDFEAERVTVEILKAISRFDTSRLTVETITRMLMNETLGQKLIAEEDEEEEVRIVREALLELQEEKKNELNKSIVKLQDRISNQDEYIEKLKSREFLNDRFRFLILSLFVLIIIILLSIILSIILPSLASISIAKVFIVSFSILLIPYLWSVWRIGLGNNAIKDDKLFIFFSNVVKWIIGFIAALLLYEVLGNILAEWIRKLFPSFFPQ